MTDLLTARHFSEIRDADWPWKNFSPAEIACRHCGEIKISRAAMDKLAAFRAAEGRPFIIHSAYRCPEHNRAVGGAKNSQHMLGRAFDVGMANHEPRDFAFRARTPSGFNGIGLYPKQNFIHIDNRDNIASWGEPFPPRVSRFSPEPKPTLKIDAGKEAAVGAGALIVANQTAKETLAEAAPYLPAHWVAYATIAVGALGLAVILYRMLRRDEH